MPAIRVEGCPACASNSSSIIGSGAKGFSFNIGDVDYHQPDYDIRDCCSCGLLFRTPRLSAGDLSDLYARIDYRVWETIGFRPIERTIQEHLRKLPHGSRLLDFGCSSGRLLSPLVRDYECYGTEINGKASEAASAKGLLMLPETDNQDGFSASFDCITMVDVFEHLEKPIASLRRIVNLLKPGGILLTATGNGDSPACRVDPAQFWYFRHAVHLIMLTSKHAQFLQRVLPLKLEKWETHTSHDRSAYKCLRQYVQQLAYWHFKRQTLLSRAGMQIVPFLRRAKKWTNAPEFSVTRDHVVAVFRK
jgi:2-polyprenyl-3-methyl-5-hydroxy-6-metoxy-1,4-benzoquinol methylase